MISPSPMRSRSSPLDAVVADHRAVDHRADRIGADDRAQPPIEAHRADFALRGDGSRLHEHDVRREPQDLIELVAHVDHGDGELIPQRLQIWQYLLAALPVQRGERLVEQQQPGLGEQARGRWRRAAFRRRTTGERGVP